MGMKISTRLQQSAAGTGCFVCCFRQGPSVASQLKNIKMSSFKSSENIQKKEGGPDRSVSDNQSSSVTLNELAMKARK